MFKNLNFKLYYEILKKKIDSLLVKLHVYGLFDVLKELRNNNAMVSIGGKWPFSWYIPWIFSSFFICYFAILGINYYKFIYNYKILIFLSSMPFPKLHIIFFLIVLYFFFYYFSNKNFNIFILKNLEKKLIQKKLYEKNKIIKFLYVFFYTINIKILMLYISPNFLIITFVARYLILNYFFLIFIYNFSNFLKVFLSFLLFFIILLFFIVKYTSLLMYIFIDYNKNCKNFLIGKILQIVLNFLDIIKLKKHKEKQQLSLCYRRTLNSYNWEIYWMLFSVEEESGVYTDTQSHAFDEIESNPMSGPTLIENDDWDENLEELYELEAELLEDEIFDPKKAYDLNNEEEIDSKRKKQKDQVEKISSINDLEVTKIWSTILDEYRAFNKEFKEFFDGFKKSPSLNNEAIYDELSTDESFIDFNSEFDNIEEEEELHFQFEYESIGRWSIYTTPLELKYWAWYQYLFIYKAIFFEIFSLVIFISVFILIILIQFYYLKSLVNSIDNFIWFLKGDIILFFSKELTIFSSFFMPTDYARWSKILFFIWVFVIYFVFVDENDTERTLSPVYNKKGNFISARSFNDWYTWKEDIVEDWKDLKLWLDSDNEFYLWRIFDDWPLFLQDMNELDIYNCNNDRKNKNKRYAQWELPIFSEEPDYLGNNSFFNESFPDFGTMYRSSLVEKFLSVWYFILFKIWKFFAFWPKLRYFLTDCFNFIFYFLVVIIFMFLVIPLLVWITFTQTQPQTIYQNVHFDYLHNHYILSQNINGPYYNTFFNGTLGSDFGINFLGNSVENSWLSSWLKDPKTFIYFENYFNIKKNKYNYRARSYLAQTELLENYDNKFYTFPLNNQASSFLPLDQRLLLNWEQAANPPGYELDEIIIDPKAEKEEVIMFEGKFPNRVKVKKIPTKSKEELLEIEERNKNRFRDRVFDFYNSDITGITPWYEGKKLTNTFFILKNIENKKDMHLLFKQELFNYFILKHKGNSNFFSASGNSQYIGKHNSWYWRKNNRFITSSTAEPIFGNDLNFWLGNYMDFKNTDLFFNYGFRKALEKSERFNIMSNFNVMKKDFSYIYPFYIHNIQAINTRGRSLWVESDEIEAMGSRKYNYINRRKDLREFNRFTLRTWEEDFDFIENGLSRTFCGLPLNWKKFSGLIIKNKENKIDIINKMNIKTTKVYYDLNYYVNDNKKINFLISSNFQKNIIIQKKNINNFVYNLKASKFFEWHQQLLENNTFLEKSLKQKNYDFFLSLDNMQNIKELQRVEKYQIKVYLELTKELRIIKSKYKQFLRLQESKKNEMLSLMLLWNNKLILLFENFDRIEKNNLKKNELVNFELLKWKYTEIVNQIKKVENEHNYNLFFNKIQNENYKQHLNSLELKINNNFFLSLFLKSKVLGFENKSIQNNVFNNIVSNNNIEKKYKLLNELEVYKFLEKYNDLLVVDNSHALNSSHITVYKNVECLFNNHKIFNNKSNFEQYYKKLYNEMKFLDKKNTLKEISSVSLNNLRNNLYIADLKKIFKNYNSIGVIEKKKLLLLQFKIKNFDLQTSYEKEQLIVLINFIGKHFGWNSNIDKQKIQLIIFLQNIIDNIQINTDIDILKDDLNILKNFEIVGFSDKEIRKINRYIEKNKLVNCFYSIVKTENFFTVETVVNILQLKYFFKQFLLSNNQTNQEVLGFFKFLAIILPKYKNYKYLDQNVEEFIAFLNSFSIYLFKEKPTLKTELKINILLKGIEDPECIPFGYLRNKTIFLDNIKKIWVKNKFGVDFFNILKLNLKKNFNLEDIKNLNELEDYFKNYKRLLELDIPINNKEFNDFFLFIASFNIFNIQKIKCLNELISIINHIKKLNKPKFDFDPISYSLNKAYSEYTEWNKKIHIFNEFYNNQVIETIENNINEHKNWIDYLKKSIIIKPAKSVYTIHSEYMLSGNKKTFKNLCKINENNSVFYATWLRNLTRVSPKNTVWRLHSNIIGPNNNLNNSFIKLIPKSENIFKEEPVALKKNENNEINNKIKKNIEVSTIEKNEKKKEIIIETLTNEQQALIKTFDIDIRRQFNKFNSNPKNFGKNNMWVEEYFRKNVAGKVLLEGLLQNVENATIKNRYNKIVENLDTYVGLLNIARKKSANNFSNNQEYKNDIIVDLEYSQQVLKKIFELKGVLPITEKNQGCTNAVLIDCLHDIFPTVRTNEKLLKNLTILSVLGPIIKKINDPFINIVNLHKYTNLLPNVTKIEKRLFDRSYAKLFSQSLYPFTKDEFFSVFKNIYISKYEINPYIVDMDNIQKALDYKTSLASFKGIGRLKYNIKNLVKAVEQNDSFLKDPEFIEYNKSRRLLKDVKEELLLPKEEQEALNILWNDHYYSYDLRERFSKKQLTFLKLQRNQAMEKKNNWMIYKDYLITLKDLKHTIPDRLSLLQDQVYNYNEQWEANLELEKRIDVIKRRIVEIIREKNENIALLKKWFLPEKEYKKLFDTRTISASQLRDYKIVFNANRELDAYREKEANETALLDSLIAARNELWEIFDTEDIGPIHCKEKEHKTLCDTKERLEKFQDYYELICNYIEPDLDAYNLACFNYEQKLKDYNEVVTLENKLQKFSDNHELITQTAELLRIYKREYIMRSFITPEDEKMEFSRKLFLKKMGSKDSSNWNYWGSQQKLSTRNFIHEFDGDTPSKLEDKLRIYGRIKKLMLVNKDKDKYIFKPDTENIKDIMDKILEDLSNRIGFKVTFQILFGAFFEIKYYLQSNPQFEELYVDSRDPILRNWKLWLVNEAKNHVLHKQTVMCRGYTLEEFERIVINYFRICEGHGESNELEEVASSLIDESCRKDLEVSLKNKKEVQLDIKKYLNLKQHELYAKLFKITNEDPFYFIPDLANVLDEFVKFIPKLSFKELIFFFMHEKDKILDYFFEKKLERLNEKKYLKLSVFKPKNFLLTKEEKKHFHSWKNDYIHLINNIENEFDIFNSLFYEVPGKNKAVDLYTGNEVFKDIVKMKNEKSTKITPYSHNSRLEWLCTNFVSFNYAYIVPYESFEVVRLNKDNVYSLLASWDIENIPELDSIEYNRAIHRYLTLWYARAYLFDLYKKNVFNLDTFEMSQDEEFDSENSSLEEELESYDNTIVSTLWDSTTSESEIIMDQLNKEKMDRYIKNRISLFFAQRNISLDIVKQKISSIEKQEKDSLTEVERYCNSMFLSELELWIKKFPEMQSKKPVQKSFDTIFKEQLQKRQDIIEKNKAEKKKIEIEKEIKDNKTYLKNKAEGTLVKDSSGAYQWTPPIEKNLNSNEVFKLKEKPIIWIPKKAKNNIIEKNIVTNNKVENNLWLINVVEKGIPSILKFKNYFYLNNYEKLLLETEKIKDLKIKYHIEKIKNLEVEKTQFLLKELEYYFPKTGQRFSLAFNSNKFFKNRFYKEIGLQEYFISKFKVKNLDVLYFLSLPVNQKWSKLFVEEYSSLPLYGGEINGKITDLCEMQLHENPQNYIKEFDRSEILYLKGKSRKFREDIVDLARNYLIEMDLKEEIELKMFPRPITIISAQDSLYSHLNYYLNDFDELNYSAFGGQSTEIQMYSAQKICKNFKWKSPIDYYPEKIWIEANLENKKVVELIETGYIEDYIEKTKPKEKLWFFQKWIKTGKEAEERWKKTIIIR